MRMEGGLNGYSFGKQIINRTVKSNTIRQSRNKTVTSRTWTRLEPFFRRKSFKPFNLFPPRSAGTHMRMEDLGFRIEDFGFRV